METSRALEIIRSLADGRDPATDEQFPPNSPYQQADTVRALFMALDALSAPALSGVEGPQRDKSARPKDPNRPKIGSAWSPEEEQQLRDEFAAHNLIPEIAKAHGRTIGAITSRLVKLGLIQDDSVRIGSGPPGRGPVPARPPRPVTPDHPAPAAPILPSQRGQNGQIPPGQQRPIPEDCPF